MLSVRGERGVCHLSIDQGDGHERERVGAGVAGESRGVVSVSLISDQSAPDRLAICPDPSGNLSRSACQTVSAGLSARGSSCPCRAAPPAFLLSVAVLLPTGEEGTETLRTELSLLLLTLFTLTVVTLCSGYLCDNSVITLIACRV